MARVAPVRGGVDRAGEHDPHPDATAGRRGAVARIVALAEREAACCPFFRFAVEVDANGLALTVTVPPDAAEVLVAFAALATA